MARATKSDVEEGDLFRNDLRELSPAERREWKRVLAEAAELRKYTNIAPLTTGELVRAVRDEAEQSLPGS
jgi:hypothetical protein